MNKGMIILGILLIAGLSFAIECGPWQYPWQNMVAWRYYCNLDVIAEQKYELAYETMYTYAPPGYMGQLYAAAMGMVYHFADYGEAGMCFDDYYAAAFRADMAGYNSDSAAFNTIFNAILRSYLSHGGDSRMVMGYLSQMNTGYYNCLTSEPWADTDT